MCNSSSGTYTQRASREQCCLVIFVYSGWVMELLSWELDDNFIPVTQHHYLPLQLDITSFKTGLNYIYLLKWAISVKIAFPEDGELARESSFFSLKSAEKVQNKRQHSWWGVERKSVRWACHWQTTAIQLQNTYSICWFVFDCKW